MCKNDEINFENEYSKAHFTIRKNIPLERDTATSILRMVPQTSLVFFQTAFLTLLTISMVLLLLKMKMMKHLSLI